MTMFIGGFLVGIGVTCAVISYVIYRILEDWRP